MYDEDLRQARQALGDGNWEAAKSFYSMLPPQQFPEAHLALALIELHKATSSQDSARAEEIAGKLNRALEEAGTFPGEFIRAFCPQVLPSLTPKKEMSLITDVRVNQWLLSILVRNMVLDYCTSDEVASLPEPEQRKLCQTAATLDRYTFHRKDDDFIGVSSINKRADPKTFKRFRELRYDKEMRQKLMQVYKALGVPDFLGISDKYYVPDMSVPITPDEEKEQNKNIMILGIIILIMALLPAVAALLLD